MRSKWQGFKSPIGIHIERFLAYRRALGQQFRVEEYSLRLLDQFLTGADIQNAHDLTPDLLDSFMASRPRSSPRSYNHLLGVTRRLLDWMVKQQTLPCSPLKARPRRQTAERIPFLFNPHQFRRLLELASGLPDNPRAPDRGTTYRTIFVLLYGLGLRIGEVCRLCLKDIDVERQLLVIRQSKFAKSRLVPFGPRIAIQLQDYIGIREQRWGKLEADEPVFSFSRNRFINPGTVSQTFRKLFPLLNFELSAGVSPARLHDLRHAFAVNTLLHWYQTGINPSDKLLYLSTFMGHVNPNSTAVYLTITEALFQEANTRFENFANFINREENQ